MRLVFLALIATTVMCFSIKIDKEMIFSKPLFPYAHAGSITELKDGTVVAVFHAGSGEGHADVQIQVVRRDPRSGIWSMPMALNMTPGDCNMNPSLFQNQNGSLFVMFHTGSQFEEHTCSTHSWHGMVTRSDDGGRSWSPARRLPEGYLGGIKNQCVTLSNGKVLCPSSTEAILHHLVGYWESHMETTDQELLHWSKSNNIHMNEAKGHWCMGVIQPTLFETTPGHIVALLRSGCQVIARAESTDYGASFNEFAVDSGLPNPGSGIDGTTMKGQDDLGHILLYNPSIQGRVPLGIAQSFDAVKWTHLLDFETNTSCTYQYPSVVQSTTDPRVAHVIYSHVCAERQMAYARLTFLRDGDDQQ